MYWDHSDALGSIYQMTNSGQTTARSYDYSAFGKIISESGTLANPFTYTAREYDEESRLYYYRARYYDPAVGRFLSRDPLHDPAISNLYVYVTNNRVMWDDPTGLVACKACPNEWKGKYKSCTECCDANCKGARAKGICYSGCGVDVCEGV